MLTLCLADSSGKTSTFLATNASHREFSVQPSRLIRCFFQPVLIMEGNIFIINLRLTQMFIFPEETSKKPNDLVISEGFYHWTKGKIL